mmetsp:Transcript_121870/g.214857  ORF Transcript_121870/g.214857 Transcript_121870/m.214857 type:complete len:285 (-) Transcript_121870:734-1588(-)
MASQCACCPPRTFSRPQAMAKGRLGAGLGSPLCTCTTPSFAGTVVQMRSGLRRAIAAEQLLAPRQRPRAEVNRGRNGWEDGRKATRRRKVKRERGEKLARDKKVPLMDMEVARIAARRTGKIGELQAMVARPRARTARATGALGQMAEERERHLTVGFILMGILEGGRVRAPGASLHGRLPLGRAGARATPLETTATAGRSGATRTTKTLSRRPMRQLCVVAEAGAVTEQRTKLGVMSTARRRTRLPAPPNLSTSLQRIPHRAQAIRLVTSDSGNKIGHRLSRR